LLISIADIQPGNVLFRLQKPLDDTDLEDNFLRDGLNTWSQYELIKVFLKKSGRDKYSTINYIDREPQEKDHLPLYLVDTTPLPKTYQAGEDRVLKDPFQIVLTDFGCGEQTMRIGSIVS
jgi:hypothetical protein